MHIPRLASLALAAILAAFALPAHAAYLRVHADPSSMTAIDSGKPDKNLSGDAFSKVLVNYEGGEISAKGVTAVLLRLPDALLSAQPADLARATLVFHVLKANNWQPTVFSPRLFPLAAPYAFSEATWNISASETPWATPGGDTLDAFVDGTYDARSQTLSFNLLPLLSDPDAAAALAANGALIRLAWDELPDSGFSMLNLHNTQAAADNLPDAYFVLGAPDAAPTGALLAMTALDSGKPDENLSGQNFSKVLVNYEDGAISSKGVTAAVLQLPEALLSADAANLSRATLVFNVLKANNWQPDVFSPRLFPLAAPYAFSEVTWNASAAETPWTTPGGDTLDAFVDGAYDDSSKTLSFDILPLLADADASAALAANGALIRLAWDKLPDSGFSMLNLHNTQAADDLLPSASWNLASAEVGPADAVADVPRIYYIDQSTPDATEWNDSVRFIVNADPEKGDTRVLMALPDLDLPTVASLGTLHIDGELRWRDNPAIPAFANVLTVPFGATEATCASWNRADHTDPETAWDGGVVSDALSFPAVFGETAVEFDLSSLLASDLRDNAFANGLLIQWDVSQRESITNSHVKHTLYRDKPAPTLAWTQRPVVHSYIDSGKPDNNFGWSGATDSKCIVLLNPGDGEARTLVKFAPSFFNFDPAQDTALLLTFPYGKEWPGEDEPNQIALQPLATPFRMGQATWNKAADGAPWTTPGGDLDETVSFVGAVDRDAQTITFDLTSLYHDPAARDEMIQNGAALRILGDHPVEAGSVGFNFGKGGGPVAVVIAADGVEFRGFSIDTGAPAEADPEPAAKDASASPTCSLDLTGLDPTVDYAVYGCSDLAAGEWTWICDVPDDGQVAFQPTGSIAFFRVQPRE